MCIRDRLSKRSDFTKIYLKNDLAMIEILGFQFSYHHTPKNDIINSYAVSYTHLDVYKRQPYASTFIPHYFLVSVGFSTAKSIVLTMAQTNFRDFCSNGSCSQYKKYDTKSTIKYWHS